MISPVEMTVTTINAHFDGKVFVPDEPVNLPAGRRVQLRLERRSRQGGSRERDAQSPMEGAGTARDLLDSGLIGIWADRADIRDSLEYAGQLRRQAEQRNGCA